jgi:hypothetical protein
MVCRLFCFQIGSLQVSSCLFMSVSNCLSASFYISYMFIVKPVCSVSPSLCYSVSSSVLCFSLSVCLFLFLSFLVFSSVCLSIFRCARLSDVLFIGLSASSCMRLHACRLSVCLSVCLSACLPARLPACPPACLPSCRPACLRACLRA